jgi:hypothetical protein
MKPPAQLTAAFLATAVLGLATIATGIAAGQPHPRSTRLASADAGVAAASPSDASVLDAAPSDAAVADATLDAGLPDAAPMDAGVPPSLADAGDADATPTAPPIDGSVPDGAAPDAAPARARPLGVSFDVTAGFGWVHEAAAQDADTFGELDVSASYTHVRRLDLRLDLSFTTYDRTYVTRAPAADGVPTFGRADTSELRVRTMLSASYDVLPHTSFGASRAQLSPLVRVELDRFDNDVAPTTDFGIGLGVRGFWRPTRALRLEGEWSWAWQPVSGTAATDDVLLLGTPQGSMLYGVGAELLLRPRMRLGVRWRGEWLANDHSDRHAQAVLFNVGMDL